MLQPVFALERLGYPGDRRFQIVLHAVGIIRMNSAQPFRGAVLYLAFAEP